MKLVVTWISKLRILLIREQSTSTATRARVTSGTPSWLAAVQSTSAPRRRSKMATSSRGILTALPSSPHTITPYSTCSAGMKTGPNKDSCFRLRRCSDMHDAQKRPICFNIFFGFYPMFGFTIYFPWGTPCLHHHVHVGASFLGCMLLHVLYKPYWLYSQASVFLSCHIYYLHAFLCSFRMLFIFYALFIIIFMNNYLNTCCHISLMSHVCLGSWVCPVSLFW